MFISHSQILMAILVLLNDVPKEVRVLNWTDVNLATPCFTLKKGWIRMVPFFGSKSAHQSSVGLKS